MLEHLQPTLFPLTFLFH